MGVALGATAAGLVLWSTLIERRLFTIRRHSLPVLSPGAAPIKILQLSDLHLAPWQSNKIDWVRSLAQLRPDLLVLTGDLMGHLQARPSLVHALKPLAELEVPTVFVHGSNDYYGPKLKNPLKYLMEPSRLSTREKDIDNARLTASLTDELGFTDLNNAATRVQVRGTHVELFGLGDPHIRYDDAARMRAEVAKLATDENPANTRSGTSTDSGGGEGSVRLGVVHAPYQAALDDLLREKADLILAGHTHGGQVRVPGIGALTSNCDLPLKQASGMSVWYDATRAAFLNVSAGLGNSIYAPIRFACWPEASLITLEPTA